MSEPHIIFRTEHGEADLGTIQEALPFLLKCVGNAVGEAIKKSDRLAVADAVSSKFDGIVRAAFTVESDPEMANALIILTAVSALEASLSLCERMGTRFVIEARPVLKHRVDPSAN